jgi:hypothetical protein
MCYKGGPYCTKPALAAYEKAKGAYETQPTEENKGKLEEAKKNYLTSPGGIEKLRESGKLEEAKKFENVRSLGIARAKEEELAKKLGSPNTDTNDLHRYAQAGSHDAKVAVANNPGISERTLKHIVEHESSDDFRFAVARHPKATPEQIHWAASVDSMRAKSLALQNPNVSKRTVRQVARDARAVYMAESKAAQEGPDAPRPISAAGKQAGQVWKKARTLEEVPSRNLSGAKYDLADSYIDRTGISEGRYLRMDKERFGDRQEEGAKFTDPRLNSVNDVVALTAYQRGSLDGDDRDKLMSFGADPKAFEAGKRYLVVQTPGKTDSQHISSLPVDSKINVTKDPTGKVVLVAGVAQNMKKNFGVVVIGRRGGKEIVTDVMPGAPLNHRLDDTKFYDHVGKNLSINHIMEIAGTDDISLKTKLK